MNISPIKTEQDYEHSLKRISELMDAKADTLEGNELDVLTTLVENYETKHYPVDFPDPVEAIKFRLEQRGLETKVLDAILGGRSRTSEILSHKRGLSLNMIRKLHRQLNIPLENLILSGTEDDNGKNSWRQTGKGSLPA